MYRSAASSVALVQSTGIEPITKTFPRKEAPAKSFGLAILIAPSELQTQESRLNLDGVCARGIVGVVRRHLAYCRRAQRSLQKQIEIVQVLVRTPRIARRTQPKRQL